MSQRYYGNGFPRLVWFNEINACTACINVGCVLSCPHCSRIFFSLLSFALTVGIIVFVVLGIHTCVLTDCSDLKSYSFKYRVRACGVMRRKFRNAPRVTREMRVLITLKKKLFAEKKQILFANTRNLFFPFSQVLLFSRTSFHLAILGAGFIFFADCTPASPSSFPQNRYIGTIVHEVMKWQHGVSRGRERG